MSLASDDELSESIVIEKLESSVEKGAPMLEDEWTHELSPARYNSS